MRIAVIGLGYVGLPVLLGLARTYPGTVGFDIDKKRVEELKRGFDWSGETPEEELTSTQAKLSADENDLKGTDVFIVCVPTPIDEAKKPDLRPLVSASKTVARAIRKGGIACFESTVYPGATEEVCGKVIEEISGLRQGVDFKLGYSPERINPGDREHTLERIVKVVAGEDAATADTLCQIYGSVVKAGIHRAPTIKVAEAAKVIENTQRDLNIALMNELSIIFDKLGIRTADVLAAAGTKWNFLKFTPGLVGGHCIGVDPYYLTTKAETVGYYPEVILAGRRINDGMGAFVARKTIEYLSRAGLAPSKARVGILGVTFKENVADIRNSRVPDILTELKNFGVKALIADPMADPAMVEHEYGVTLDTMSDLTKLDALIFAVPHKTFLDDPKSVSARLSSGGVFVDIKSAFPQTQLASGQHYWSL
jgi:UDP-N-acetyl-D-galactosamine dehydrogenase